jgi:hypothetical protein
MKMSADYMQETVEWMAQQGFAVHPSQDRVESPSGALLFERSKWLLTRDNERFALESLLYPSGKEAWYLAIEHFHGLRCNSYPLDSWKHRAEWVEFKFQQDAETGLGLAFTLEALNPPSPS